MKLIARLTLRALKENRRRTMATMLAIIIATAMLCSITTLAASAINGRFPGSARTKAAPPAPLPKASATPGAKRSTT